MAGLKYVVRITGVRETLAALNRLPDTANDELRDRSYELAQTLAAQVRAAGMADTPQSARAASSVRAQRDRVPVIRAGGTKKANAVLFGSEFGMTRKSGWYRKVRYFDSVGRQYREHLGAHSYWFFRTVEEHDAEIERAWQDVTDAIIRAWGGTGG